MFEVVDVLERLGSNASWENAPFDAARDAELAQRDAPESEAFVCADADALLRSLDVAPFQAMIFPAEEDDEDEDEDDEDAPAPDAPPTE